MAAAVVFLVTRSDSRDAAPRTWATFCAEAHRVADEVARAPDVHSAAAFRAATARVTRLADAAPSARLRSALLTASPLLTASFSPTRPAATSPRLLATDDVDTALAEHCGLGRAIFVPPAAGVLRPPGSGLSTS